MIQIPALLNPERSPAHAAVCFPRYVHCKGSSPPPPAPPPVYEPPPALTPPPAAPVSIDYTAEREAKELEKNKEKISRIKQGRSSTILTGLLTEAPPVQKAELKKKLGE